METLLTTLVSLAFLVPVVFAQFAERERWARYVTYGLLMAINVMLVGFAGLTLLNELAKRVMPEAVPAEAITVNWLGGGMGFLFIAILASTLLLPAARRWLARWLPIDPGSMVHVTALTYSVYWIGLSVVETTLIGDLENLTEAGFALSVWDVLLTGLPMILFALVGVGLFVRRGGRDTLDRLGLRLPTGKELLLVVGATFLLLGFDFAVNVAWQALDPAGFETLVEVTDSLFSGLVTVAGALALGLSAGISEELLFRGAVQPRLGIVLASVLFAVGHVQYGFTVATLEVFAIGLVLGLVRNRTHTTICILIHAGYNAAGVLLGMLQP
jgi:membrane protease YdiL (CAAX protease family)